MATKREIKSTDDSRQDDRRTRVKLGTKKCRSCGEYKYDTQVRVDPYAAELWGDGTPVALCDECTYQRAMDI